MTLDLKKLAMVAERTSNAVVMTDANLCITWVNEGFTRVSGYSAEEALGRTPSDLLRSELADSLNEQRLRESAEKGVGCRVELLNHAKDGHTYWLDIEVQPIHDDAGQLTGFIEIGLDVTQERVTNERLIQALLASDEQKHELDLLARVARETTNAVVLTNANGLIEWVNEGFTRMTGFTLQEALGLNPGSLLQCAQTDLQTVALMRAALSQRLACKAELLNRAKDGRLYWLALEITPQFDLDGRHTGFMAIQSDVTERKEAENKLRESESRFKGMLVVASDWYWETDDQYRFTNVVGNEGTQNYSFLSQANLGLRRWELMGVTPVTSDWAAHMATHDRREIFRNFEYWRKLDSGEIRHFDISGFPIFDAFGTFKGYRGTTRDVTAQRQQERELQTARDRIELATESGGIGIWVFDVVHNNLQWDERMFQLYGQAVSQGLQPYDAWSESLHPEDKASAMQAFEDAIYGKRDFDIEFRIVWPGGAVRHLHGKARVQRDDQGRALEIVGVNFDITQQKAQASALLAAKHKAEQASQFKSQFLANMSHEIRTPMNAILGMLKLMQNTELQPRQRDYVEKTEGAAKSLLGLLNDILDFSKVEAGKMTLEPEPFALEQLMRELGVILSANVGDKPLELLFDIGPRLPGQLLGDRLRLQQILINLGGNAIKFTPDGHVVLRVRLEGFEDATGDLSGRLARVHFAVQDSGIGIAPENQQKIFAGFTQAESTTTRRFGGTGLGLAICRRLIELMGGQLQLQSALGQGSLLSFSILLPVLDAEGSTSASHHPTVAPAPSHAPGLQVLVVDDHPMARELMIRMGKSLGWQVETADSGEAALAQVAQRKARGEPYQLLFVDGQMPGLDGWQTSTRLRLLMQDVDSVLRSFPPIIMLVTAHGRERLEQQTTESQAFIDGYLVKPVTTSMLLDAVQNATQTGATPANARAHIEAAAQVHRPLNGLRLLLVEDNAINQQVADELLRGQGATVDIADNGLRGVEAVQAAVAERKPYDAVLMDVQMPVMDGLQATRQIRRRFAGIQLPIIAMTANAMASDREDCLAAGMDDHIGKPFELNHLVAKLLEWTQLVSAPQETQVPKAFAAFERAEAQVVTSQTAADGVLLINRADALRRVGGSVSLLDRLSTQFLIDLPNLLHACEASAPFDTQDALARGLHTLKGVAGTMGADALAQAAHDAEQDCKSGKTVDMGHLRHVVAQTRQALFDMGFVEPTAAPSTGQASRNEPALTATQKEILDRLLPLLDASNMAVFDVMAELLAHDKAEPQRWAALNSEVQMMAFDRAAERVRQCL